MAPSTHPVGTLFGVPASEPHAATKVAVLGVPFDMGYHATRVGARSGPAHIRANSHLVAEHLEAFDVDLLGDLGVVDVGDVSLLPGDTAASFGPIQTAVEDLLRAGVTPLTFGGDGAVTLPQLRALHAVHGPGFAVLHLDAHTDALDNYPHEYNNANTFIHAVREGLIDPASSLHVGMRDTAYRGTAGANGIARDLGYDVITVEQVTDMGVPALLAKLRTRFDGLPVYLCWDMDVFDPSLSGGVVTPSWGGITVREGLAILRGLRGLDVVAFDINTVSPPHDPQGVTAALAAQVALECLFIANDRP
jgi:agmatinase